jgi:hypothetical protein
MSDNGIRAFSDMSYDYYELTQSIGLDNNNKEYILPAGSIFYHDKSDSVRGSIGDGCLKLCWTPDGNCYGWICGGSMAFHAAFKNTDLFRLVQPENYIDKVIELKNAIAVLENQLEELRNKVNELP